MDNIQISIKYIKMNINRNFIYTSNYYLEIFQENISEFL